jgi:hypothetical protein
VDRVVYLLGAGFSAPLGLPVMSNFLLKSKDLFASNPARYAHFSQVFNKVNEMSVAKNYYATDLFDIEEILSILEMNSFIDGGKSKDLFAKYISDVIQYFTPSMRPYQGALPSNWQDVIFGTEAPWRGYGYFALNLCNAVLTQEVNGLACLRNSKPTAQYSILTLNYDMVLENVIQFVRERAMMPNEIGFGGAKRKPEVTLLAKLHGSADEGIIVPPTWSKGTHPEIVPIWREAKKALREANHIRVIGYSLPTADTYIRYLFKSAVLESLNLKSFDVLSKDPDGSVRRRYDDFVTFNYYRFVKADVLEYLQHFDSQMYSSMTRLATKWYDRLEDAHESFFAGSGA